MNKELIAKLQQLATRNNMTDRLPEWIAEGRSYEAACAEVMDARDNSASVTHPGTQSRSETERKELNLNVALRSFIRGDSSAMNELGREVAQRSGIPTKGNALYIPVSEAVFASRALALGNTGANLATQQYLSFEDALREKSVLATLGVDIRNSNGILTLPYMASPLVAEMVAETGSLSVQEAATGNVQWTPKRMGARVEYSQALGFMNAEYSAEEVLTRDMFNALTVKFEQQVIAGSGTSNEATGLLFDANIPVYAGGTGSFDLARAMKLWQVARDNHADVSNGKYLVTTGAYVAASSTAAFSGATVPSVVDGKINNCPILASAHIPATFSTNRHGAIFGDFSSVIATTFGVIEIIKDEVTQAASGKVVLNAGLFMDSKSRVPKSLVLDKSIIA